MRLFLDLMRPLAVCACVLAAASAAVAQAPKTRERPKPTPAIQRLIDDAEKLPTKGQPAALEKALAAAHAAGDRVGEGLALNVTGNAYCNLSQFQKALGYYNRALATRHEAGDRKGEAGSLQDIGSAYLHLSEYMKALDVYTRAMSIQREIGDHAGAGRSLYNVGTVYLDFAQYSKALDAYGRALTILWAGGAPEYEPNALTGIGNVYVCLGQYAKALKFYNRALSIERSKGYRQSEASTLMDVGVVYDRLGQYAKALDALERALPIHRNRGDRLNESGTLTNVGIIYDHLRQYAKALVAHDGALRIQRNIGDRAGEGGTLCNLGSVYGHLGNYPKARDFFSRALPILREIGHRDFEANTLDNLAIVYRESGQTRVAAVFAKQGINVVQSERADVTSLGRQAQMIFRDRFAKRYRRLADWLAEDGRLAEAQQVLSLLKDEEYFDFIGRRAGGKTESVDLTPKEADWVKQYDALGDKLAADVAERDGLLKIDEASRTPEQKKRLFELRAEADSAGKAFATFIAKAEEAFASKAAPDERVHDIEGSVHLQQTLKDLPGRPAALYTLMTADGVRVIVDIPGLSVPRQAKTKVAAADLNKKILAFREALTDPKLDPRPLGAELYDLLVRPVEKDLTGAHINTLMWSLDGTLRFIPVWALYDRETKQYLIEKYPSCLFTSHTVDGLTRAPRKWTGAEFGVTKGGRVGDVKFGALPGVGAELAGVHLALGGPAPKVDDAFTLEAFRDALEALPGVVHVATHFHFKPGDEAGSILLLGKGQSLSVEALRDMSENALGGVDLLVLSACETAMSGDSDGKEFEGFALLAQLKGAGAVLATLWPVADESTALLMGEFYRLRKAHPEWTKLEALRTAQLEMMRGRLGASNSTVKVRSDLGKSTTGKAIASLWPAGLPKYAHPYYWAPFVLTGNWK
jgi:CHAT domain-containing protein/tetratricopeptide (TPR) repeat protein